MKHEIDCDTYIPTVLEYREALGVFGTVLMIVGGIITLILFTLFFEQVYFTYNNSHKRYRRHVYWISSIYPFMCLMSVLAVLVPRAHQICNAVKVTFMSIGVGHFADLTIEMFGGSESMLNALTDTPLNLQVQPACCCCRCLPSPPVTKSRLSYILYLVWVMKWTQGFYFFVKFLWTIGLEDSHGDVTPSEVFLWLNIINFISFFSGVYALQILCAICAEPLKHFHYKWKSLALRVLILLTKLQTFVFDIMGFYGAFPCLEDKLISQVAYKQTVINTIYIGEMIIAGLFTYYMYHTKEFKEYTSFNSSTDDYTQNDTQDISTIDGSSVSLEGQDLDNTIETVDSISANIQPSNHTEVNMSIV